MTRLPDDVARCLADRQCPSAGSCRRHIDRSGDRTRVVYADWESIRGNADHCDGFLPINPDSSPISQPPKEANP